MDGRVLLLTYAFPPMSLPEASLAAKRMGNLPGVDVDVLCLEPFKEWMGNDRSLDDYVTQRFAEVARVTAPRLVRRLPLGRLGPLVDAPDQLRLLNHRMAGEARGRLAHGDYDAVVTWSQWHSIHLVGERLRREGSAPVWVAHFSDPWMGNPYVRYGRLATRRNARLERRVVEGADLLLVTSRQTRDLFVERYGEAFDRKVAVLPHAYDPELFRSPSAPSSNTQRVVRHLGAFYGPRSPLPLLESLASLATRRVDLAEDTHVELIGPVAPEHRSTVATFQQRLPEDMLAVRSPVDYTTSLDLMAGADLLLVLDAPASTSPFLPSKLIDYVGAARPILGITPPGPSEDLIRAIGGWVAPPDDASAIVRSLEAALEECVQWRGATFGEAGVRDRYSSDAVGAGLVDMLGRISGSSKADRS